MKIGMLFPDYGSQFVGMGKELYDNSRLVQEYFEEAFNCLNINFVKLCFASSDAELAKIENASVSIFLVSVATAAFLKQENIIPHEVAGYGIGEISALCRAGGLTFPDGLYFLHKYAQFYQDFLAQNAVALLKISDISAVHFEHMLKKIQSNHPEISLSALDTDNQLVVSGYSESIMHCKELALEYGATVNDLSVAKGLHSSLLAPVVDQLVKYLEKIDFTELSIPLISSLNCTPLVAADKVKKSIIDQLKSPVYWNCILQHCVHWDIIIEIGPGTTLAHMLKEKYPDKIVYSINKLSDIEELRTVINTVK